MGGIAAADQAGSASAIRVHQPQLGRVDERIFIETHVGDLSAVRAPHQVVLLAARLSYFNENDDIELTRPRLVSLQPGQPQLQASSERARVTNAGETVLMQGDVLLRRDESRGQPPLSVRTERMTVIPDTERFSSDVPVLIEQGDSRLSGDAMDYDNLRRVLTVSGRLRGELAPAKR